MENSTIDKELEEFEVEESVNKRTIKLKSKT